MKVSERLFFKKFLDWSGLDIYFSCFTHLHVCKVLWATLERQRINILKKEMSYISKRDCHRLLTCYIVTVRMSPRQCLVLSLLIPSWSILLSSKSWTPENLTGLNGNGGLSPEKENNYCSLSLTQAMCLWGCHHLLMDFWTTNPLFVFLGLCSRWIKKKKHTHVKIISPHWYIMLCAGVLPAYYTMEWGNFPTEQ